MATKTPATKIISLCAACGEEFTGKKCPECGNASGNSELNKDGVPREAVYGSTAVGNAISLRPVGMSLDSEVEMSQQMARSQEQELSDNLRESFVLKSEIKRLALEDALKKKQQEYAPEPRHTEPEPHQPTPDMNLGNIFPQNTMSPQAQFMNQFMKMDVDARSEFLEQLSGADPAALSTLSSFFAQNNPQMAQTPQMNPYMQMPSNPYMQFPPPWQQQPQQEQQFVAEDPTMIALTIVEKIQDLSGKNQGTGQSENGDLIEMFREEMRTMNERISSMASDSKESQSAAFSQRMTEMENYLYSTKPDSSLQTQIAGIKNMVNDLRDIGFMETPESKQTVDEQIRLNEAKHQITKEDRELELQEKQLAVDGKKKDMQKALVSSLFSRQLHKSLGDATDTEDGGKKKVNNPVIALPVNTMYAPKKPDVVVEEFITDSGVVRETSVPIAKKKEESKNGTDL